VESGSAPPDPPVLDRPALRRVVRGVLGSAAAEPLDWSLEPVDYPVVWQGSHVHRVRGTATDAGRTRPWRAVLKVLRRPVGGGDGLWQPGLTPEGYSYWRREADLYRDGVLDRTWGDFRPPLCYGVDEPDPDTVHLWLEEVEETVGHDWPLARHALAARHLGQFNGRYLVREPVLRHPSFGRGYRLSPDAERRTEEDLASERWQHPAVRAVFPPAAVARIRRVWAARSVLLRALERAPTVFVHRDAFRNNLIACRDRTVAVDWALAGPGHLGEDLYKMVKNDAEFVRAPAPAKEMDAACFGGYLDGLCDAGWTGDPRVARLGYAATTLFQTPYRLLLHYLVDPDGPADAEREGRRPADEVVASVADMGYLLLALAEEAIVLAERAP
jgi:hypothetical protein